MSDVLLHADEEAEPGVYGAYLRAQTDDDLLDIARHLDPERYPARCDAAGRELRRRSLLHSPAYTATEMGIRYFALAALALSVITLALTALLTPDDAAQPSWPEPEMVSDGMSMSQIAHLFGIAILRGFVVWDARFGVYLLLLAPLGGWLLGQVRGLRGRRVRLDVLRLALLGAAALLLAMNLAAGPRSAVPSLFPASAGDNASGWERALPLWDPFAAY